MKMFGWIFLGFLVTGLAFWIVVSPWTPKNPIIQTVLVAFFIAPSVGAFWML